MNRGYPLLPDISISSYSDHLGPMVLLALNTGLRRGELFNLKWSEIDFIINTLTVVGVGNNKDEGSKSGQTRIIPLNSEASTVLKKWRNQIT
ncbi:MAG: tyrosine-type recombinase/integrase, partial [Gammaproteobacteria bacterium]|nr:tyrosine-type recombinase/integrase [Gammaproteobacteria bacterium]